MKLPLQSFLQIGALEDKRRAWKIGRKGSETIQLRLEGRLAISLLSVASPELKNLIHVVDKTWWAGLEYSE